MPRYMIHLENSRYAPQDSRHLVHRARRLCGEAASVRVCRVASDFVELDVSTEDLEAASAALSAIGIMRDARCVDEKETSKDEGMQEGIFYYNSERYWEAHEAWEGVWKQCEGREKLLVQGLILLAVSFAHAQKNDAPIGVAMLARAREKIGGWSGTYHGIDIDAVRGNIDSMRSAGRLERFSV